MKKIAVVLFFLLAAGLQAQTLSWDIKLLKGKESVPINQIIRMETGDVFQISITPASDCYGYVVCYDSSREISVLHNQPLSGGRELFLGPFEVEHPTGTETLYVIMSLNRQTNLEDLIQSHARNPSRQNVNNLYREVLSLQNAASALGEPASTIISSGGTSRGEAEEYATRFAGKDLYVRTIAIRH